jgi:hypothetical protein
VKVVFHWIFWPKVSKGVDGLRNGLDLFQFYQIFKIKVVWAMFLFCGSFDDSCCHILSFRGGCDMSAVRYASIYYFFNPLLSNLLIQGYTLEN